LALHAAPHPDRGMSLNNLANVVQTKFKQQGDSRDLDEAITLHREALALRAPPHPDRGTSLCALAVCLATTHSPLDDKDSLDTPYELFQQAATYLSSSPLTRFQHALLWTQAAVKYNHTSFLAAYYTAMNIFPSWLHSIKIFFRSSRFCRLQKISLWLQMLLLVRCVRGTSARPRSPGTRPQSSGIWCPVNRPNLRNPPMDPKRLLTQWHQVCDQARDICRSLRSCATSQ
jgi:hypothetical protein